MSRAIVGPPATAKVATRGVPEGVAQAAPPADDYSDKLLKLIPGEVIGVYLSMTAILGSSADEIHEYVPWLVFLFGMVATYFYLRVTLKVTDLRQLLVTVGAFCVWAYAVGLPFQEQPDWYNGTYAGLLLAAYTFIAPKIPMGENSPA